MLLGWLSTPDHDKCMTTDSATARWNRLGVNFAEGGKPNYPEKNSLSKIKINKSQPTYELRIRLPGPQGKGGTLRWPLIWLIAQMVKHCSGIAADINPVEACLLIFRLSFRHCSSNVHTCDCLKKHASFTRFKYCLPCSFSHSLHRHPNIASRVPLKRS